MIDYVGVIEIGLWGYFDEYGIGMYVNESEFIVEFFLVDLGKLVVEGELFEFVLMILGWVGSLIFCYCMGDLVWFIWNYVNVC